MLAILSDLHLADGTTSTTLHPSAFDLLRQELIAAARKNDAKELKLLLLGDIFDLVRTEWWFKDQNTPASKRPWNGQIDPNTGMNSDTADVQRQFSAVLTGILEDRSTVAFIKTLQKLAASKIFSKFEVKYVIGNHDRALNNFPVLRNAIQTALNVPVEFMNSFADPAYAVAARHAHEWDENCNARLLLKEVLQRGRKWDYLDPAINLVQNLGEIITAELMSGFVWRVKQTGDDVLTEIIRDVDLLRPATDVFQWVEWQARNRALSDAQKQFLAQALVDSLSGVIDSEYGKLWDKVATDFIVSGDLVDRLQLVRSRLRAAGYEGLRECVKLLVAFSNLASAVVTDKAEDYEGARTELERLGPEIQYLVYGHTHCARHKYLTGNPSGRVQMYINTGTYLPLLQTTDDGRGFAQSHQMTLTFFYKTDEDTHDRLGDGPTVDIWNGIKRKQYKG